MCRKDAQRKSVYLWEDTIPLISVGIKNNRKCSLAKCRKLIIQACDLYNLPCVDVYLSVSLEKEYAAYYEDDRKIMLSTAFLRQDTALHEAAHYITSIYWSNCPPHGEVFVRVYMHLMHSILGADMEFIEGWARFHKVKFSTHRIYEPGRKTLGRKVLKSV